MKVPTVFERLAASGLRVGLYDYLITWPPQTFPGGFVIPGWLRRDDAVTPPNVWSRVPQGRFVNSYDRAYTSEVYLHRAGLEVREKAARWNGLAEAFDLDVGAVIFYAVDMTAHRYCAPTRSRPCLSLQAWGNRLSISMSLMVIRPFSL